MRFLQTTGQVESLERLDSGGIIVTFRNRAAAEQVRISSTTHPLLSDSAHFYQQGLAKGINVPTIGVVQVSWYTGQPLASTAAPKVPPNAPSEPPDTVMTEPSLTRSPEILHSPRPHDEEVVASGWGEDGDGEDGMGML